MEKKKNIIYFRGQDVYGVQREMKRWTKAFRNRHDANNIDTYRIEEIKNWSELTQNILTQ